MRENVDAFVRQIFEKWHLIAKPSGFMAADFGDQRRIDATAIEIVECRVVEGIVLIVASQKRQKVQPGPGGRGAEIGELRPANLGRMEIGARMPALGAPPTFLPVQPRDSRAAA
ncbi:hypothetical protein BHMPCIPO_06195 [Ensifer sesbaniae]|uniref:hypothetical protein n=1 Tax=Ensifer sesbaniae TaxID=1214071 RepID=UPI0015684C50|nr:hypothetical protein [Ensifer sesbaniae]NRQ18928.1 hypothetical protein [Ensifer sesbaniae]